MRQYAAVNDPLSATGYRPGLRVLNVVFLILTLIFNYLAIALPLNRRSTGEISAQYPNLFTPAGLTFSIWSVIYLAAFFFVIWQAVPLRPIQRAYHRNRALDALGWDFVGLCTLNMLWLFCWHYGFLYISVLVMLLTLWLLIRINTAVFRQLPHTVDNRNFLQIPFGLYLGWISVATIANVTVALVDSNWDGWGLSGKFWTMFMILVATILAALAVTRWSNIPFALAVTWALFGISLKHQEMFNVPLNAVILAAYFGMLVLLIVIGRNLYRWWTAALPSDAYPPGAIRYKQEPL